MPLPTHILLQLHLEPKGFSAMSICLSVGLLDRAEGGFYLEDEFTFLHAPCFLYRYLILAFSILGEK